jgi:hypothetical protein
MNSRTMHRGAIETRPGSHHAPYTQRGAHFIQLAGLVPPAQSPGRTLSGQENESASFPDRPFLVQFLIDVACVISAFLLVAVTGAGLAFAAFCLFFVSF